MDRQPSDHGQDLDPRTAALAAATVDIARHLPNGPLDRPHWYALVRSAELLAQHPSIASLMGEEAAALMSTDDLHLTPVDLDDGEDERPAGADDPLQELASLVWPPIAAGGAMACTLPRGMWEARTDADRPLPPALPDGSLTAVVAALEDGTAFSALRGEGEELVVGPSLLPQLAQALTESLREVNGS